MIPINKGEGLCEYIRRMEGVKNEISDISGVPMKNIRKNSGLTIMGNQEFIKKFMDSLPDEYK